MAAILNLLLETWRDIPDYRGYYQCSSFGRVRSLPKKGSGNSSTMKYLTLVGKQGYNIVHLRKNGKGKVWPVHRLVAKTFIPNPNGYGCVNHKNRDKKDNRVENLEWCSFAYNINYEHRDVGENSFRVVQQMDKRGRIIGEFSSIIEASKTTGVKDYCISSCVRGVTRTAGGYMWKYNN